jgi:hypothetical protein
MIPLGSSWKESVYNFSCSCCAQASLDSCSRSRRSAEVRGRPLALFPLTHRLCAAGLEPWPAGRGGAGFVLARFRESEWLLRPIPDRSRDREIAVHERREFQPHPARFLALLTLGWRASRSSGVSRRSWRRGESNPCFLQLRPATSTDALSEPFQRRIRFTEQAWT